MKTLAYQQRAVDELTDKTIRLLNLGGHRRKIVFEAPTGTGKTVMACQMLANLVDELKDRGDSRYEEVAFIWFAPRKLHLQSYDRLKEAFSYVEAKQEGQAGQFVSDAALLCSSGENFPYSVESFPQSFLGTAKCLSQLHILYDIIDSACLSPDLKPAARCRQGCSAALPYVLPENAAGSRILRSGSG